MQCVIFDFDGTIADTTQTIIDSMLHALKTVGCEPCSPNAIQLMIGLPLRDMFCQLGHIHKEEQMQSAICAYEKHFNAICEASITLYPGVVEVLSSLKNQGVKLAIATSRSHSSLELILRNLAIENYFDAMMCNEDVSEKKPHPEMAIRLMEQLGVGAAEVWVVGDTSYDIQMGAAAGCRTCGITQGNHSEQTLRTSCANVVIDQIGRLLEVIA